MFFTMTVSSQMFCYNGKTFPANFVDNQWLSREDSLEARSRNQLIHSGFSLNAFVQEISLLLDLGKVSKKKRFFGISFPNVGGWGGWFPNKVQIPQKKTKSPRKSPFSTRISPIVFPNLTKTLGWVGGKTDLGKISQIKRGKGGSPYVVCWNLGSRYFPFMFLTFQRSVGGFLKKENYKKIIPGRKETRAKPWHF